MRLQYRTHEFNCTECGAHVLQKDKVCVCCGDWIKDVSFERCHVCPNEYGLEDCSTNMCFDCHKEENDNNICINCGDVLSTDSIPLFAFDYNGIDDLRPWRIDLIDNRFIRANFQCKNCKDKIFTYKD